VQAIVKSFLPVFVLMMSAGALVGQVPVGREIPVSQPGTGLQWLPDVGVTPDGSFVVVWEDFENGRVLMRLYEANGQPRSGELRVSDQDGGRQSAPSVLVRPDGTFVVVWYLTPVGNKPVELYALPFDAEAEPQTEFGDPRLVAYAGRVSDREPAGITLLPGGSFVITWSREDGGVFQEGDIPSRDVYGRRFNRHGSVVGGRFTLNAHLFGDQSRPQCAVSRGKELVCAWMNDLGEGSFGEIALRRFDLYGKPRGNEVQVNSEDSAGTMQSNPALAVHADGTVLVVWEDFAADPGTSPFEAHGVMGRLLNGSNRFLTRPFRVPTATRGGQAFPSAIATAEGFAVVWGSQDSSLDGSLGAISLRTLRVNGTFTSGERVVNVQSRGAQDQPALAFGPGGGAIAWATFPQDVQDGEVVVRRLRR
jgi:hypothetical protein